MSRKLRFTLLGTGSSGGVPRVGNDWGVCDPTEPKNRRRRCSALVEVYADNKPDDVTRILIDTSPDLREQLLDVNVGALDAIVFTHDHADQTHGIDDVRAIAIRSRSAIKTYLDMATADTLVPKFQYVFEGQGGYPAILDRQDYIEPKQNFEIDGAGGTVSFLPLDQAHGRIRSLGFRIGPLAYCNDVSDLPTETLAELSGLEMFIVDALRYTPHPTHANVDQALGWIETLKPKAAILTNLHVDLDYQTLKRELPSHVTPAYDGLHVTLDIA